MLNTSLLTASRLATFRRLWLSSVITSMAQGIERTLTAWLALQLGADAFEIGLSFAARMLPSLLLGLAAGTIADRTDRSRQLGAVALAAAILMSSFAWLVTATTGQVWYVIMLSFIAGCIMVFDTPARQALVLDAVPKDMAQRALALNALAGRFATAIGALIAGLMILHLGIMSSYLVVALLHIGMMLLVTTMHVPQEHHLSTKAPPFQQALIESVHMIRDLPAVRTLIMVGLICEIFAFSHLSAIPLFAQDVLAAGPAGLGILNAALGIGGVLGVLLLSFVPEHISRRSLLGAVYVLYGLAILGFALTHELVLTTVLLLITGFCAAAFDVLQQTLIQLAVPAHQRGRAVGLWILSIGSAPLGHLEMGMLATLLGVPIALLINGALTFIAAILLLLRSPEYRWRLGRGAG